MARRYEVYRFDRNFVNLHYSRLNRHVEIWTLFRVKYEHEPIKRIRGAAPRCLLRDELRGVEPIWGAAVKEPNSVKSHVT